MSGCTEVLPEQGELARLERELAELEGLIEDGRDELLPVIADRLIEQARLLDEAGDGDAAFEALDSALDQVDERTDDASRLAAARVWTARADYDRNRGDVRESLEKLERADVCYTAVATFAADDRQRHALVLNRIGFWQWTFGQHRDACATLDRGLAIYAAHGAELDPDEQIGLWLNRGNAAYATGDTATARDLYERVIARCTGAPGCEIDLSAALIGRGNACARDKDRAGAIDAYRRACEVLDAGPVDDGRRAINLAKALTNLAGEHQAAGQLTDALAAQSRAVDVMFEIVERDADVEHQGQLADARSHRARILAELGHFEAAIDEALEVIESLEDAHEQTGDVQLKRTLELIKKELGPWERRRAGANLEVCSFCSKPRASVRRLITGSRAVICDGCWEAALDQRDAGAPSSGHRCDLCNEAARDWFHTTGERTICDDCLELCTDVCREDGILRRAEAAEAAKRAEGFRCSFCARKKAEVRKLISGPRVFICDNCVCLCLDILARGAPPAPTQHACSFCSKAEREIVITGPNDVLICNECVDLCREIIEEEIAKQDKNLELPRPTEIRCSFCDKPRREVKKLVTGNNVVICDECIGLCMDILEEECPKDPATGQRTKSATKRTLACSFCNTHEARSLITGLGKQICDRCADRSLEYISK